MKFGAVYCLYDDYEYLDISLEPVKKHLDIVLFLIGNKPLYGKECDNTQTINKIKDLCNRNKNLIYKQGNWKTETDQRNFGLSFLFKENIDFTFIIDTDEIYHEYQFQNIIEFIKQNSQYNAFHIEWNTYWKKDYYKIYPRENFKPIIAVKTKNFMFNDIKNGRAGTTSVTRTDTVILKSNEKYNGIIIPKEIAICYHLSYARTDEKLKRKLETFSHSPDIRKDWFENVWKKWNPQSQNLHPIHPQEYKVAIKEDFVNFPNSLKTFIKKEKILNRICSIIILNWNSCELLQRCLDLVKHNTIRKNYELIIVDNGSSKDNSVEYIKSLKYKKIFNKENLGFAPAVNQAIKLTKNSDICLLNVDAEPQKNWLNNLYETMINNSNCGIVGPLGNEIENGYQREGMIDKDIVTTNVHGFCFLIMRELFEKIGYFDESYKIGGCEDMDFCFRARLARYESYISAKSLVRHKAHQVYDINKIDHLKQDKINTEIYHSKFFGALLDYSRVYNLFENEQFSKMTGIKI